VASVCEFENVLLIFSDSKYTLFIAILQSLMHCTWDRATVLMCQFDTSRMDLYSLNNLQRLLYLLLYIACLLICLGLL